MESDTASDGLTGLTPEKSRLSGEMEGFMDTMETTVFDTVARFNGALDSQTKSFEFEEADHVVRVARGSVVEKCGFMRTVVKKELPPMMPEPLVNRYMQIDIYPKTPLVGMFHSAMNFSYNKDGSSMVGGIMDITPGTIIEEDLNFVKGRLDKLFEEQGLDADSFRESLLRGHHKDRLKAACVGVSFFKMPFFEIDQKNFTLVKTTIETFFDAYVEVLAKRKDQGFEESDTMAMFDMRRRWLEKQFMWDPFTSMELVPYEVWSLQDLPPNVTF